MRDTAVIRVIEGRLAWYPPGASEEPEWLDEDEVARERLQQAINQRRLRAIFAAPGAEVRLLSLPVSAQEKKHFAKALPFTLEEQVAEDIADLHFAAAALDADTYAVAVCSLEKMQEWQDLLSDFPGVQQWLPEPLLLPRQSGEWCLLIEGDQALVRLGECAGFSAELALLQPLLEGALAEGEEPDSVIVYGRDQTADTALLPESLQSHSQWRQGNFYSALMLSEAPATKLNLLQGNFAPQLPLARWWRQWRTVAALLAVAFGLQLAAAYAEYRELQAKNLALRGAIEQSYRSVFPKGQIIEPEKQLRRQLNALRGTGQSSGFIALMEQVGSAFSSLPDTQIASINYSDKSSSMRMNIVAADFEGVEKLRAKINETGLNAVMESSNARDDKVRARLRVEQRS